MSLCPCILCCHFRDVHGTPGTKGPGSIPLQDQHLALAILLELAVQRGALRWGVPQTRRVVWNRLYTKQLLHFLELFVIAANVWGSVIKEPCPRTLLSDLAALKFSSLPFYDQLSSSLGTVWFFFLSLSLLIFFKLLFLFH